MFLQLKLEQISLHSADGKPLPFSDFTADDETDASTNADSTHRVDYAV